MGVLLPLISLVSLCAASTVTLDWSIDWVTAAPDGYSRQVIGINGKWPCPKVEVDVGDTVVMNIKNNLGNQVTGIHCHGEFQDGSGQMDGVPQVSQCPIQPGGSFTHTFTTNPSGSHWFHSHSKAQYPDGLRGPMIIHDAAWEDSLGVDKQYTLTVSDWYHTQTSDLIHQVLTTGGMPAADASLMNDGQDTSYDIQPGKKYLFRVISMSAFYAHTVQFQGHQMSVVAVDGEAVTAADADALELGAGQRYDVVITAKDSASENYAISSTQQGGKSNTGTLKYTNSSSLSSRKAPAPAAGSTLNDLTLVPSDNEALWGPVTETITLNVHSISTKAGPRMTMGNESYVNQKVPSLYTALSTGKDASNPAVYGAATNPYVVKQNDVVQIEITNEDGYAHPIHLHGHRVQVVARGSGKWNGDTSSFPKVPMRRDTVTTQPGGYLILRFQATNPGVWPIHCHMEWHVDAGMRATIIEAPDQLQQLGITISEDALAICKAQNIPTEGNCAGKTGGDVLDTSDCNNSPDQATTWGSLVNPPSSSKRGLRRLRPVYS